MQQEMTESVARLYWENADRATLEAYVRDTPPLTADKERRIEAARFLLAQMTRGA